jgi:hypothetical protein
MDTVENRQSHLPETPCRRVSWRYRLISGLVGAGCLVILLVAVSLEPSPAGVGTHRQLDMPACGFLERTQLPCPTCGMTTAFSHLVRGQIVSAMKVQPAGAILAIVCVITVVVTTYINLSGRRPDFFWMAMHWRKIFYGALALFLFSWLWLCGLSWWEIN